MKYLLLLFLWLITFYEVLAFRGECLFKLQNVQNESWWLYVQKIEGENYYDRNHQLVPTETILEFSFQGPDNIKYPENVIVTLKIYDILGTEVATLVSEEKVAGRYDIYFDASSLASGIYIYKLQAGDPWTGSGQSFVNSNVMILLT